MKKLNGIGCNLWFSIYFSLLVEIFSQTPAMKEGKVVYFRETNHYYGSVFAAYYSAYRVTAIHSEGFRMVAKVLGIKPPRIQKG